MRAWRDGLLPGLGRMSDAFRPFVRLSVHLCVRLVCAVGGGLMQGHSFNLNKRGFSGDSFLGPYGFSGRAGTRPNKNHRPRPLARPRPHFRTRALLYPVSVPNSKIGAWPWLRDKRAGGEKEPEVCQ